MLASKRCLELVKSYSIFRTINDRITSGRIGSVIGQKLVAVPSLAALRMLSALNCTTAPKLLGRRVHVHISVGSDELRRAGIIVER